MRMTQGRLACHVNNVGIGGREGVRAEEVSAGDGGRVREQRASVQATRLTAADNVLPARVLEQGTSV